MDRVVVVIPGASGCSRSQAWEFLVSKNVMAQCIFIEKAMSVEELKQYLEKEFKADMEGSVTKVNNGCNRFVKSNGYLKVK